MTNIPGAAYGNMFGGNGNPGQGARVQLAAAAQAERPRQPTRQETEAQMWRRLKDAKFSDVQIAGIMGNLSAESGLDPSAVGDSGQARGLAQWHADRYAPLTSWAKNNHIDPSTIDGQTDMILHETNTTERRARQDLQGASDLDSATDAFAGFERPQGWRRGGDPANISNWDRRRSEAQRYWDTYHEQ